MDAVITGLYVPGHRPDRFDKAVATGADLVILDLEDAVPPSQKEDARRAVVSWLERRLPTEPLIQVRVNPGDVADIAALRVFAGHVTIRLPKVDGPQVLDAVPDSVEVVALIETALGLERAFDIGAHERTGALALGEADLASDVGSTSPELIQYARIRLVLAARANALPAPMASAWTAIRDIDGLRADTRAARAMGMVGRTAVHPTQLSVIVDEFRPGPGQIAWAREVLAVTDGHGASILGSGAMVDAAMVGSAERILRLAELTRTVPHER